MSRKFIFVALFVVALGGGALVAAPSAAQSPDRPAAHATAMPMPAAKFKSPTTKADKIKNAMSAGPASIAEDAAVMDYPATSGGKWIDLRKGSNGWTCIPDDPTTPVNDPMCIDKMFMDWMMAFMAGANPKTTSPGIGYMLQGGVDADNDDPSIMTPPAGKDWQVSPPHIMFIFPGKLDTAIYPKKISSGAPWIMFQGTPYEHVMVPVPVVGVVH